MSGNGKQPFDRAEHCRRIAAKGGKATVAKYGRGHMSAIGRKGYLVTTCRYFLGSDRLHNRRLSETGLHNYWKSTGLPMKYGFDGHPIWPEEAPTHPAQTTVPGQRSLFEALHRRRWEEIPF